MIYTKVQKKNLLENVRAIRVAMRNIMDIDDASILNEVGLETYPFGKSFDDLYLQVSDWEEEIEKDIQAKRKRVSKKTAREILGGNPLLISDDAGILRNTGSEREPNVTGILLYPKGGYISVLSSGEYNLHIERSEYIDKDLSKLEPHLAKWVEAENPNG